LEKASEELAEITKRYHQCLSRGKWHLVQAMGWNSREKIKRTLWDWNPMNKNIG